MTVPVEPALAVSCEVNLAVPPFEAAMRPSFKAVIGNRRILLEAVFGLDAVEQAARWWETAVEGDRFTLDNPAPPLMGLNIVCRTAVTIPAADSEAIRTFLAAQATNPTQVKA